MLVHSGGDADPAGLRQGFEASGYVDSVAMNIVVTGDDVTQIDADAQFDAMRVRKRCVPLGHGLL